MTRHYLYEPYQPMDKAVWGPGNYYAPRPPVVTSAMGDVTILCVDGGARLFDDSGRSTECPPGSLPASRELVGLLASSQQAIGGMIMPYDLDGIAKDVLVLPRGAQWRDALRAALVGDWSDPLWENGQLPVTALGALKAQARRKHRQEVPLWRRRTRHGRVLSLDADLGGLSLYDLVAPDVDLLAHTTGGVFADERLNTVLRGLDRPSARSSSRTPTAREPPGPRPRPPLAPPTRTASANGCDARSIGLSPNNAAAQPSADPLPRPPDTGSDPFGRAGSPMPRP
ncbi:hypothetical protein ABZ490_29695 [Streptomyces sp. NPDC005811]|uniref:hypothetical protein n=1 Tax=Streptomyces sp. NPDC005811 TaxID=3154565 RepID=UPI0033D2E015